jgi:hypothetical protein
MPAPAPGCRSGYAPLPQNAPTGWRPGTACKGQDNHCRSMPLMRMCISQLLWLPGQLNWQGQNSTARCCRHLRPLPPHLQGRWPTAASPCRIPGRRELAIYCWQPSTLQMLAARQTEGVQMSVRVQVGGWAHGWHRFFGKANAPSTGHFPSHCCFCRLPSGNLLFCAHCSGSTSRIPPAPALASLPWRRTTMN